MLLNTEKEKLSKSILNLEVYIFGYMLLAQLANIFICKGLIDDIWN